MRVVIPFGPRKITGFVIDRMAESSISSLKEIIDVLDVTPVLTHELLHLGKWLANETLSLYITTYHAMLPQVLKAKYSKVIKRETEEQLPDVLEELFSIKTEVNYEDFIQTPEHFKALQKHIQSGDISIDYIVKNQAKKKYQTLILPAPLEILMEEEAQLHKQAVKQRLIIDYFINHPKPIEQKQLYQL